MAEFNLFLGTARKSVGDVTLLRRAGRQIARVRLRHIANPKSDAQCETRNYLSPVIKFYGPLRDVLARSFEGYNKADSYNQFQRQNIALARKEGWFMTKGTPFYPMPYLLSQGQLQPVPYYMGEDEYEHTLIIGQTTRADSLVTIADVSRKFVEWGYKNGDVATLLLVLQDETGSFIPDSAQMIINVNDTSDITTLGITSIRFTYANFRLAVVGRVNTLVAGAVIIARRYQGRWLRSTQRLAVAQPIIDTITSAQMKEDAIKSYGPYASGGGGGVYPGGDGEPFSVSTISGRALLFYGGQYNALTYAITGQAQGLPGIQVMPANVDDYFYIKVDSSTYLGTNAAGSLNPADWRRITANVPDANDSNSILLQADTPFYRWLQSCGYAGA